MMRDTPRTFVGKSGSITDHSKSVRSNRAISTSKAEINESEHHSEGNPLYGFVT